jgi:Na+-translocating ferredoxin:NAD+ oxidoreductase RnfC subunit
MSDVVNIVRQAGIVGAGGAGFPTHVKVGAQVDTVIANGAECEPLLRGDKMLMLRHPEEVLDGLTILARATGAARVVLALKAHYSDVVDRIRTVASEEFPQVEVFEMGNFYPAGDEQTLVHEVTGKVVPEGGIPLAVGCVVNNVVTLFQLSRAVRHGEAATYRPVTIVGDVAKPRTAMLPVGTPFSKALELAGGAVVDDPVFIAGGPMMGVATTDPDTPIDKRCSGLLVLDKSHPLVRRKMAPMKREVAISRAACCQCRFCTDLCPRYLLGHDLHPHLAMYGVNLTGFRELPASAFTSAYLCCMCGICEVYSCPLGLSPRKMYAALREELSANKIPNPHHRDDLSPRPQYADRKIPVPRLITRLGLTPYEHQGWDGNLGLQKVDVVRVPLKQHLGAPATPVVAVGDKVKVGDMLGEIPENSLGARVHASIDGVVTAVNTVVEISRLTPGPPAAENRSNS